MLFHVPDLQQGQFSILNLIRPRAPNVIFRFHDDLQSFVQPFRRHIVGIKQHKTLRRINEADFESDRQPKVAFGQVARARQPIALEIGVLRSLRLEIASFVVAQSDETRGSVESDVEIRGIRGSFAFAEVDQPFGNRLIDGTAINDVAIQ